MGDPDSTALLDSLLLLLPFKVVPLRDSGPVRAVWLYFYSIATRRFFTCSILAYFVTV